MPEDRRVVQLFASHDAAVEKARRTGERVLCRAGWRIGLACPDGRFIPQSCRRADYDGEEEGD